MGYDFIKTREDAERLPRSWYAQVQKTKEKAWNLMDKVVALNQVGSIVVGKVIGVDIDRIGNLKYPYCKITFEKASRFRNNGDFVSHIGDMGVFFVNRPEMVLTMDNLGDRFPEVFAGAHKLIRKDNRWGDV